MDKEGGSFYIGQVQKMRRLYEKKWGPCRQLIDLQARLVQHDKKASPTPTTQILLNWFSKVPRHLKFKYNLTNCEWIDIDIVISTVTMSYITNTKLYTT